jgi:hypothetical protein
MLGHFFASKATVTAIAAPVTTAGTFVQTQLLATGNFFLLTVTPVAGSLALYLNGLYLTVGVDYTLSQNAITLLHKMLTETDVLTAWYLSPV